MEDVAEDLLAVVDRHHPREVERRRRDARDDHLGRAHRRALVRLGERLLGHLGEEAGARQVLGRHLDGVPRVGARALDRRRAEELGADGDAVLAAHLDAQRLGRRRVGALRRVLLRRRLEADEVRRVRVLVERVDRPRDLERVVGDGRLVDRHVLRLRRHAREVVGDVHRVGPLRPAEDAERALAELVVARVVARQRLDHRVDRHVVVVERRRLVGAVDKLGELVEEHRRVERARVRRRLHLDLDVVALALHQVLRDRRERLARDVVGGARRERVRVLAGALAVARGDRERVQRPRDEAGEDVLRRDRLRQLDRRGAVVDDHLVRLDVDALVERRLPQHVERLARREADVDGRDVRRPPALRRRRRRVLLLLGAVPRVRRHVRALADRVARRHEDGVVAPRAQRVDRRLRAVVDLARADVLGRRARVRLAQPTTRAPPPQPRARVELGVADRAGVAVARAERRLEHVVGAEVGGLEDRHVARVHVVRLHGVRRRRVRDPRDDEGARDVLRSDEDIHHVDADRVEDLRRVGRRGERLHADVHRLRLDRRADLVDGADRDRVVQRRLRQPAHRRGAAADARVGERDVVHDGAADRHQLDLVPRHRVLEAHRDRRHRPAHLERRRRHRVGDEARLVGLRRQVDLRAHHRRELRPLARAERVAARERSLYVRSPRRLISTNCVISSALSRTTPSQPSTGDPASQSTS